MTIEQKTFEGWAVVELLGHGREVGYVTTLYFGNQAMFQIDVPEIPERDVTLLEGTYHMTPTKHEYIPRGAKVRKSLIPSKQRLVSSSAVFAINPTTEDLVRGEIGGGGPILLIIEVPQKDPNEVCF